MPMERLGRGHAHGAVDGNERLIEKAVGTGFDRLHDALQVLLACVGIQVIVAANLQYVLPVGGGAHRIQIGAIGKIAVKYGNCLGLWHQAA